MKCSPKRRSVLALAISGLVFTSAVGCGDGDQRAADKKIHEDVAQAAVDRQIPTTQGVQKAITTLKQAESTAANASLTGKIEAKSNLAQAELEAGHRAARDLARIEPQISQVIWEIRQIGVQIDRLNAEQAAGAKAAPEAALKGIADRRQQMTAAGEAAAKKAADLQAQIDKIKSQVATLTQQKDAASAEADGLSDKASKASGQEAFDLANQATEARRKAGNLGHEIDKVSAALLPLERDLAVEQGKKKNADAAIAALEADKSNVDAGWQLAQGRIQEQKQQVDKLAQALNAKAQQLDALNKQAAAIRGRAAEQYANSAKHAAAAATDASNLARELGTWSNNFATSPEKKAWDQLKSTYSIGTFRLAEAAAQNALGNLHNLHALQLQAEQQLAAAIAKPLQEAGLQAPASLSTGAVDAEHKKAIDAANAAYTEAAQKYIDVYQGSGSVKELQNVARISRMFALYSQYLAGDKSKLAEAKQEFAEAFADRKDDPIARLAPAELRGEAGGAAPAPGNGGGAAPAPGRTTPGPRTQG